MEYFDFLVWLKGVEDIIIYDNDLGVIEIVVKVVDIIFCFDFNFLDWIDKVGDLVRKWDCIKIMIDYYLYLDDFVYYMFLDIIVFFISEVVFDFVEVLGDKDLIDKVVGECVFIGILIDIGFFKYSILLKLFRIVFELLVLGVDDYKL